VLFYWTTSNLWTMCQQFYVIRNNPAPGTPAAKAKQDRDAAKRARKGLPDPATPIEAKADPEAPKPPEPPKRQQPKKQTRSQRKKQGPPAARPAQPSAGGKSGPATRPGGGPVNRAPDAAKDPDEGAEPGRKGA
jgi:YidC/Oxa1 family membrane protein insertase